MGIAVVGWWCSTVVIRRARGGAACFFFNFYKSVSDGISVENFRRICVRQKILTDFFGA